MTLHQDSLHRLPKALRNDGKLCFKAASTVVRGICFPSWARLVTPYSDIPHGTMPAKWASSGATLSANGRRLAEQTHANISKGRFRPAYRDMYTLGATSALSRAVMGAIGWTIGPRLSPAPVDPTIVLRELEAWRTFDGTRIAPSIACPTLVIGTQLDPVFMPTYANELAALIPRGTAVTIPRLGHAFPRTAIQEHISPFLD